MTLKYNPQMKIELFKLASDGTESPLDIEVIPKELSQHGEYKPIKVSVSGSKSLGSTQDSFTIKLENAPFIEEFRSDYSGYIEQLTDSNWRVYVYAWWSNSRQKTDPPHPPVFVGDIVEDFDTAPSGINDTSLILTANSHSQMINSGKLKKKFSAGLNYQEVVDDLFSYMSDDLGYNLKTLVADPESKLSNKILKKPLIINRNPTETLNDICRDLDFTWGVDGKALYMLDRQTAFTDDLTVDNYDDIIAAITYLSGQTSLPKVGRYTFSVDMLYDPNVTLGKVAGTIENPQINSTSQLVGRVNNINYNLHNYDGHDMTVEMQHIIDGKVILPPKRDNVSGRRT